MKTARPSFFPEGKSIMGFSISNPFSLSHPSAKGNVEKTASSTMTSITPQHAAGRSYSPEHAGKARKTGSLDFMRKLGWSGFLPGIKTLQGENWGATLLGKAADIYWNAPENIYKCAEQELRPHCEDGQAIQFRAGLLHVVYLSNPKDINEFCKHTDKSTQRADGLTGVNSLGGVASFGLVEDLLDDDLGSQHLGIIHTDVVSGPIKNEGDIKDKEKKALYKKTRGAFDTAVNGSKNKRMLEFYYVLMNEIISSRLEDAAKSEHGVESRGFSHLAAMDLGASAFMEGNITRPSDIMKRKEGKAGEEKTDWAEFFQELVPGISLNKKNTARYALNSLKKTFEVFGGKSLFGYEKKDPEVEAKKEKIIEYASLMFKENYQPIFNNKECIPRKKWEILYEDKPFPATWKDLLKVAEESEEDHKKIRGLMIDYAFLQFVSSDTTAQTMDFGIRELLKNPEYQQKIRDELKTLEQEGSSLDELMPQDMKKLPFLSSFVMELLRMYPPAPLLAWIPKTDFTIPLHGKDGIVPADLKAGSMVILDNEKAHHVGFENGKQFAPDRWTSRENFDPLKILQGIMNREKGSEDFRAFLSGLRACPGRVPAFMEAFKLLGAIARDYDISANVDDADAEGNLRIRTLKPDEISMAHDGPASIRADQDIRVKFAKRSVQADAPLPHAVKMERVDSARAEM
jgi:hypothetical protein